MTNEAVVPDMGIEVIHLSNIIKRPLVDEAGERLGRVQDLVARVGEAPHPPVVGLVVKVEGRDLFVPIGKIGSFDPGHIHFEGKRVDRAEVRTPAGRTPPRPRPLSPPPHQCRRRTTGESQ